LDLDCLVEQHAQLFKIMHDLIYHDVVHQETPLTKTDVVTKVLLPTLAWLTAIIQLLKVYPAMFSLNESGQ